MDEIARMFSYFKQVKNIFTGKFRNCIDPELEEHINSQEMTDEEMMRLKTINEDDELQLLQTLINLQKIAGKVTLAMKNFGTLVETSAEPNMISDSQVKRERKMLRVKSDHQLYLIKDITQEVTKILEDADATKQEFDYIHSSMLNAQNESYSDYSSGNNQNTNYQLDKAKQLMNNMNSFVSHLEQLFHELIDRSTTIIDNGDLVEKNYARLLKIVNGKSDHVKKVEELYELNEEHLRTILKLRKDLVELKKANERPVPQLPLEKMRSHQPRPQSEINMVPKHEQVRAASSASLKRSIRTDHLGQSIQDFDIEKENMRLKDMLHERESVNDALEKEIVRKNEVIRSMHQSIENANEITDSAALNRHLEKQRAEFQKQFDDLNDQYELKCIECKKLVDELNNKDRSARESQNYPEQMDYNVIGLKDENSKLSRELMIVKDEANKYRMRLNQLYKEIDSYKSSLHSYEQQ